MRITREACRAAGACYTDEQLAAIIPPEGLTPREVAALEDVPIRDRAWALCYAAGASPRALRLAAVGSARRALARIPTPDPRSVRAVDVAERYARGEATDAELIEARRGACAAAYAYAAGAAAAYTDAAEWQAHVDELAALIEGDEEGDVAQ